MHGPSFSSFHFFLFSFFLFPQINQFYYFTSLHVLQDVENHSTHLRDIELKLVEKFHIFAFPMYYSLCNWIGEHEITKPKKVYLLRIQKKKDTKTSTKRHESNGMTQNGLFDIFSNAHA